MLQFSQDKMLPLGLYNQAVVVQKLMRYSDREPALLL